MYCLSCCIVVYSDGNKFFNIQRKFLFLDHYPNKITHTEYFQYLKRFYCGMMECHDQACVTRYYVDVNKHENFLRFKFFTLMDRDSA